MGHVRSIIYPKTRGILAIPRENVFLPVCSPIHKGVHSLQISSSKSTSYGPSTSILMGYHYPF